MDHGLEALAEEEDEEYGISDDSISDDDEQGDGGVKKGEPNKFDALSDGVINASALLHASLNELLELKDELLRHALPPNVLMKIALCTTKVFRSQSDLQSPLNELLRMVRLYSTPWEEKSAALKKLHEDYNSKKDQLNIAVKRLQLIDAHSRAIARERKILNWEKLFSKLSFQKGHGRRWKFLIEPFKRKCNEGPESLQAYIEEIEGEPEATEDGEDKDFDTQMQHVIPSPSEEPASIDPKTDNEASDEESEDDTESLESGKKSGAAFSVPSYIKPPMKDKESWTHEPEYDRYLHIRVYKPEGLDFRELRCYITYGKTFHKTNILDPIPDLYELEEGDESKELAVVTKTGRPIRGRGRGMMRGRGSGRARPGGAVGKHLMHPQEQAQGNEDKKDGPHYEELKFPMPEIIHKLIARPKSRKSTASSIEPEHLKIAVHYGPKEEMIGMATIEAEDLTSLDLPVVYMRPPEGDVFPNDRDEYVSTPGPFTSATTSAGTSDDPDKVIKDLQPVNFPLYSIQAGLSDGKHSPNGQLPLVCFWAKQLQPHAFDRATDAETVRDIVYEATGFDIDVVSKEELHKETREQCLSAMSFTSDHSKKEQDEEGEENTEDKTLAEPAQNTATVPREDYDRLMQTHRDEMEQVQEEYELKLQNLVEQFSQIQDAMMDAQSASNSPHQMLMPPQGGSAKDRQSPGSPINIPAQHRPRRAKTQPHPADFITKKNFSVAKPLPVWGENLPKDFFERLKLFEEESRIHQEDLTAKTQKEIAEMFVKKLAAEYKLATVKLGAEGGGNPMEDVCLPAVFMPSAASAKAAVYNPRAAKYFHATGSGGVRLTQPPSMLQLPPIPKNKLSVVNLFDVGRNFQHGGGNQWLMERYLQSQPRERSAQPQTPLATLASSNVQEMMRQSTIREATSMTVGSSPIKEAMLD